MYGVYFGGISPKYTPYILYWMYLINEEVDALKRRCQRSKSQWECRKENSGALYLRHISLGVPVQRDEVS
jgi:hypothetical protein